MTSGPKERFEPGDWAVWASPAQSVTCFVKRVETESPLGYSIEWWTGVEVIWSYLEHRNLDRLATPAEIAEAQECFRADRLSRLLAGRKPIDSAQ
jgi:hypothetical protein